MTRRTIPAAVAVLAALLLAGCTLSVTVDVTKLPTMTPAPSATAQPVEVTPTAAATDTPTATVTPTVPVPTATETATMPAPTATATGTATPAPPLISTGAITVNVPLLPVTSGDPLLDANNWAIVWAGKVSPAGGYAQLRIVGALDGARLYLQAMTPTAAGDSATVTLGGRVLDIAHDKPSGWQVGQRCGGTDGTGCRGWTAYAFLPWGQWASGAPQPGDVWPMTLGYHGAEWRGVVRWGGADYAGRMVDGAQVATLPLARDGMVGGGTDCGAPAYPAYFPTWGALDWPGSPYVNVQAQWDVADWPCYSRYYAGWTLPTLPDGAQVVSATLTLYHFGNPGYGAGYATDGTGDTVLQVWDVAGPLDSPTWDGGPLGAENISRATVRPIDVSCPLANLDATRTCRPAVPVALDVTAAVQRAMAQGRTSAAVLVYTAAGQYHAGKYFYSSAGAEPPTVSIAYVVQSPTWDATPTSAPATPTATSPAVSPPTSPPVLTPTSTPTVSPTLTPPPTATSSPTPTRLLLATSTPTSFVAPTASPTATAGSNPTWAPTASFTPLPPTATATPSPSATASTSTPALTPTATLTPSATPTAPATASPTPRHTATPGPTIPVQPATTPTPQATGKTYHVSTNGNDTAPGTASQPWRTFARAWRGMQAGDTLLIGDGTYTEPIQPLVAGREGAPVTIKAVNDGKVIIDGQGTTIPLKLGDNWPGDNRSWFVVEGIVAKNGTEAAVRIRGDHIILRHVSAYDAGLRTNSAVMLVGWSSDVLLEDVIAAGTGRKSILVFTSERVTVRRAFTRWERWDGQTPDTCAMGWPAGNGINPYNSKYVVIENALVTGPVADAALRITINHESVYSPGMQVLGSIAAGAGMDAPGQPHAYPLVNDPACYVPPGGPPYYAPAWGMGVYGQGDAPGVVFRDVLAVGNAGWGFASLKPSGVGVTGGTLDHATLCNNNTQPGAAWEKDVQGTYGGFFVTNSQIPGFQDGVGARLVNPDRYVDGVLTDAPLLPWPMQDRAASELGVDVTGMWQQLAGACK